MTSVKILVTTELGVGLTPHISEQEVVDSREATTADEFWEGYNALVEQYLDKLEGTQWVWFIGQNGGEAVRLPDLNKALSFLEQHLEKID